MEDEPRQTQDCFEGRVLAARHLLATRQSLARHAQIAKMCLPKPKIHKNKKELSIQDQPPGRLRLDLPQAAKDRDRLPPGARQREVS